MARAPATVLVVTATITATVAYWAGPDPCRRLVGVLGMYHGTDLAGGAIWRLPLSALLAQSWLQLIWTVFIGVTVLSTLEVRIGTAWFCVVLAAGHVVPTLAVDGWAMWAHDAALLSVADFGPSCLVGAGVAGLAVAARSRLLALLVLGSFAVDALINSAPTVAEHAISTVLAAGVIAAREYAPGARAATRARRAGAPAGLPDRDCARRAGLARRPAALRRRRPTTSGAARAGGRRWRQNRAVDG